MRMLVGSIVMIAASLAAECPPPPSPPPPPPDVPPAVDAGENVYARACANLAINGCSEGLPANCATTLERAHTARIIEADPVCLATKHSKAELRRCSRSIVCP